MKDVLVFGNIPLGTKILELLEDHPKSEVAGVVCDPTSYSFDHHAFSELPCVYDYAKESSIEIFDLEELPDRFSPDELHLGISARNNDILREQHLSVFQKGVVNCHGGILPEYRGLYSANFAILDDLDEFGGTIHYMTLEVDEGPVIDRAWFQIDDSATAYDVFLDVTESLYRLVERNIDDILESRDTPVDQEEFVSEGVEPEYYSTDDLEQHREVDPEWPLERIDRHARAFTFPGHEPAYFEYGGRKIYLTLDP